jgi:hypothetical protein
MATTNGGNLMRTVAIGKEDGIWYEYIIEDDIVVSSCELEATNANDAWNSAYSDTH